ncbi:MAG: hypothetical protein IJ381_08390 [Clostridia bacterium]|nr:hypothetical protein [Clostridia bacterium]MBQ7982637.1 hypothetical protein [Clostridia bacterium]
MKITIQCGKTYQHASPLETKMQSDKRGERELMKDKSYDWATVCLKCKKDPKKCRGGDKCFKEAAGNVDR